MVAVMFTFSFGSAFALPSDGNDPAGLAEAKAAAIAELNDYVTLSDYTAEGQTIVRGVIASYTSKINDAATLGAIELLKLNDNGTVGDETDDTGWKVEIDALAEYRNLDGAKEDAVEQLVDYAYLIQGLGLGFDLDEALKLTGYNVIGYDAGEADYAVAGSLLQSGLDAINAAVTDEGVEGTYTVSVTKNGEDTKTGTAALTIAAI